MTTLAVNGVLGLVKAAFILGRHLRAQAVENRLLAPIRLERQPVRCPPIDQFVRVHLSSDDLFGPQGAHPHVRERYADVLIFSERGEWRINDTILFPDGSTATDPTRVERINELLNEVVPIVRSAGQDPDIPDENPYAHYVIEKWKDEERDRKDRVDFLLSCCEAALSFLNYKTDALGLSERAERIVAAVVEGAQGYVAANREQLVETAFTAGAPKRIANILVTTALTVGAERPELVSRDENLQALVRAVMNPLRRLNAEPGTADMNVVERVERVREAMSGPVAVSVLETLHARRAELFGLGDKPDESEGPVGVITEALLHSLVSNTRAAGDIRAVFSPEFVARIYPAALEAVAAAPEAFVRGKGEGVELSQELLAGFSSALAQRRHVKDRPALARELFGVAMGLTRKHARSYLAQEASSRVAQWKADTLADASGPGGDRLWAVTTVDIVCKMADQMIESFAAHGALVALEDAVQLDFLAELVDDLFAVAIRTPGMILPSGASPEVVKIAEGVASLIASSETSLLTREGWRQVSRKALDLAMLNPHILFGMDVASAEDHLAVKLASRVLTAARESLLDENGELARRPGHVLFGDTLVAVLEHTFELATANSSRLLEPEAQDALIGFIEQLDALMKRDNGPDSPRLSASDWLIVFKAFAREVVVSGQPEIPEERLLSVLSGIGASKSAEPAAQSVPAARPAGRGPSPVVSGSPEVLEFRPVPVEEALG